MSDNIDPNHIDNITNFSWHDNVSIKDNTITYEGITFTHDVVIVAKNQLRYNDKTFKYNKSIPNRNQNRPIQRKSIIFKNCTFINLTIKDTSEDVNKIDFIGGTIENFNIKDCEIHAKFYINKQYGENKEKASITNLVIKDTTFHENFKLHNSIVSKITIEDTDFKKHADFFKSTFIKGSLEDDQEEQTHKDEIGFKAINFKGLALFGDTEFQQKLIFKYVTFESFSHFRKSKLPYGLDLDYANIQNEMNFFDVEELDTKEAKNNTSQETYRIIKHNFEKIGNKIEANKYFAFELEQKKINLEINKSSKWTDYIVFQINWLSSEFGTNWRRVLGLICCIGFMTVGFVHFELLKQLFFHPSLFKLEYVMKAVNEFFQYLYILNKSEALISHPATLLFNKITLGYLYYQFLISIRKDTRK